MKKYQAATMAEALALIRAEMGPDAVILHASEIKRGPLGILSRPQVEVVAALDDAGAPRSAARAAAVATRAAGPRPAPRPAHAPVPPPRRPDLPATTSRPPAATARNAPAPAPPTQEAAERDGGLREMRSHVHELRRQMGRLMQHSEWPGMAKLAPPLVELYQRLLEQEVEPSLAQELVTTVDGELSLQAASDRATVLDCLGKHLRRLFATTGPLVATPGEPVILFLVGPTGVGKTTTLAKLAANLAVQRHRVALLTCDTYRIAAIPQLRTYADILRMPIEVAYTPDELTSKVVDHLDRDFVLVDTPGRSQRNPAQLEDLKRFVLSVPTRKTYLTVAAGTRYRDMLDVVKRFGTIPFDGLLMTKLDETSTFGPILNLVHQTRKPLTYLTTGQNVPQDIEVASAPELAAMLVEAAYEGREAPLSGLAGSVA